MTYTKERDGSYLWAPQQDKAGRSLEHHTNVMKVRPGDVVVHYAKSQIQALGEVSGAPKEMERPEELPTETWGRAGFWAPVRYFPLTTPIHVSEIVQQ